MKKIGSNDNVYDFQIEHDTIDIKFVLNSVFIWWKNIIYEMNLKIFKSIFVILLSFGRFFS